MAESADVIIPRRSTSAFAMLAVLSGVGLLLAGCSASTTRGQGVAVASISTSSPPSSSAPTQQTSAPTPTSSAPTSTAAPVPTTPLRIDSVQSYSDNATYSVKVWVEDTTINCEGHAYGAPVIAYLKAHLCKSMTRLLASTTVGGRPVGIAQTMITFTGDAPDVYQTAGDFKTLVTQDGTGNISDLLREGKRFPNSGSSIASPDAFSAQGEDSAVGIDDLWYLDGPTPDNAPVLMGLGESLFLQLN